MEDSGIPTVSRQKCRDSAIAGQSCQKSRQNGGIVDDAGSLGFNSSRLESRHHVV